MHLRMAVLVLALAVATATPVPLSACLVPMAAPEECQAVPHCDPSAGGLRVNQMAMDEPAVAVEASLDTSCCHWSTTPAQEPATVKKVSAPDAEFIGLTLSTAVALPVQPEHSLPADWPLNVSPPERQALLCVFLI